MKYRILITVVVFNLFLSYAQTSPEDRLGAWYTLNINNKVANKLIKTFLIFNWRSSRIQGKNEMFLIIFLIIF